VHIADADSIQVFIMGGSDMNKTGKRLLLIFVLSALLLSVLPATALANAAEPPSLVILVNNPPDDLSIVMVSGENQAEATVRRVAWEGYYVFYSRDMRAGGEYTLRVAANGESFTCTLSDPPQKYNNVYTLDISRRELTPGEYPFRSVLLVAIRLLLTLLIEGVVFWLLRFRQRRSWIVFLAVNLATQGLLNIWLSNTTSPLSSYLIFSLIIGEFFVFAAEMIALPLLIREKRKGDLIAFAFLANLLSLAAGGFIISVLPV